MLMTTQAVTTISQLREAVRSFRAANPGQQVGFVPTMGYLHEGHASLIERARRENGLVVLSIFVNPLQFGPNEDFDKYPRDPERDLRIAAAAGADLVFLPEVAEMYPQPTKTTVSVRDVSSGLCGASRPGHFDGVSTVVTKLFNMVQPDKAYFGLKDAQQVAVIEQMTADLNIPVQIVRCPTMRETDGLAKSSRNVYLSPEERKQAIVLNEALAAAERAIQEGPVTTSQLDALLRTRIQTAPLAEIDYAEIVWYPSIEPVELSSREAAGREVLLALAVKFGRTRLIDNRIVTIPTRQ
ncbi:pantoate--beta-alanine ligase [Paenibacillus sp. y28]|uniref:pantoate--beta-alanine ligase n=1 Tax=Paenibacillus sp. y28 TaxID=3129110 RepID=UPI00301829D9